MKAKNRGRGLAIELAINIFGVMLSYWTDYGMSFVTNDSQFRFPLAFQILFAIITFVGILLLPESPRWLIAHDRHDEARQILWAVQKDAKQISIDDPKLSKSMAEIQHAIEEERNASKEGSFRAMLKNGEQKFFYRTMLGIGGQFMQQISGINLITYVSILCVMGLGALLIQTTVCACNFPAVCRLRTQPLFASCRLYWNCLLSVVFGSHLDY